MKRSVAVAVIGVVAVAIAGAAVYWRMQPPPPPSGLVSEQDKDAFIASAKQSCIQSEMNDPATQQAGYTEAQIGLYCQCAAEKAADVISPDEVQYIRTNRAIPPSFQQKTQAIAQTCRSVTLPAPAHQ
jgi:cytoskeletal protein RodZ